MPRLSRDRTAEGNKRPPKHNTSVNGQYNMEDLHKSDKGKKSLRVDERTVILVTPKKHNEKYAQKYKSDMDNRR